MFKTILRRNLGLSLIYPTILFIVIILLIVAFGVYMSKQENGSQPVMSSYLAILLGLATMWSIVSTYMVYRRKILTPLRLLRQKLGRAGVGQLETIDIPHANNEMTDVLVGYNQMVASLTKEIEEKQRIEREKRMQDQLAVLGLQAEGLAHDIASPLAALKIRAKLAVEGDKESAEILSREIDQLSARTRHFTELFKNRDIKLNAISLDKIVMEQVQLHSGDKNVDTEKVNSAMVMADAVIVGEILENLLRNAVRHCSSNVYISVEPAGEDVFLTVVDDGSGIDSKYMEKLFRPLFTTEQEGHGLGLYISKIWAQFIGGELTLQHAKHPVHKGAAFTLSLPALKSDVTSDD